MEREKHSVISSIISIKLFKSKKRPISAVADNLEVRNAKKIDLNKKLVTKLKCLYF